MTTLKGKAFFENHSRLNAILLSGQFHICGKQKNLVKLIDLRFIICSSVAQTNLFCRIVLTEIETVYFLVK